MRNMTTTIPLSWRLNISTSPFSFTPLARGRRASSFARAAFSPLPLGLLLLGGGESMMMLEVSWWRGEIERRYKNDHFDRRMPILFSWDTVIAVIGDVGGNNKCSGRNSVRDSASEGKGRGGDGKLFEKAYVANKSTIPTAESHPTDQPHLGAQHDTGWETASPPRSGCSHDPNI